MKNKKAILIYSAIILLLFIVQYLYTQESMNQIRYEELAESIRNVFWLDQHTIYDGTSSNIGWYGTLLLTYKTFGFDIHTAKFVRLFLHLLFCISVAIILCRLLGPYYAWLPLLTIGLSPTLLYFNTFQSSMGIDLQYVPICLLLALSIDLSKKIMSIMLSFGLWFIAMIASMSYPTFVLYLPFIGTIYLLKIKKSYINNTKTRIIMHFIINILAFSLPLIFALFYLKDIQLLLNDPTSGDGIFRGGGGFLYSIANFVDSLKRMFGDLFIQGRSYYFELNNVEFSNLLAILPMIVIVASSVIIGKEKRFRLPLLLILLLMIIYIILPNLSKGLPGIRRNTGLLISFYALFVLFIKYFVTHKSKDSKMRIAGIVICAVFLLHHIIAYPANLATISNQSVFRDRTWFAAKESPRASLNNWLVSMKNSTSSPTLACVGPDNIPLKCRYAEIYAAIAGHQQWNNLEETPILGYDWKAERFIPLSIQLWESYYFPH